MSWSEQFVGANRGLVNIQCFRQSAPPCPEILGNGARARSIGLCRTSEPRLHLGAAGRVHGRNRSSSAIAFHVGANASGTGLVPWTSKHVTRTPQLNMTSAFANSTCSSPKRQPLETRIADPRQRVLVVTVGKVAGTLLAGVLCTGGASGPCVAAPRLTARIWISRRNGPQASSSSSSPLVPSKEPSTSPKRCPRVSLLRPMRLCSAMPCSMNSIHSGTSSGCR